MTSIASEQAGKPRASPSAGGAVTWRDFSMAIALILVCGYFMTVSPMFASARNLSNLAVEFSITAILALGMLLIIVTGNIDLSIGSGAGLFGAVAAVLVISFHVPALAAMGIAVVAAVALWTAMGSLIVTQRIPSFIITLAGLLIFRGVQQKVIGESTIPVVPTGGQNLYSLLTTWYLPPAAGWVLAAIVFAAMCCAVLSARRREAQVGLKSEPGDIAFTKLLIRGQMILLFVLVCNQYQGIPLSAVILGATALGIWVLTQHTRFGRYLYAIGGNEEAALISGVPVKAAVVGAFAIMGLIVALGGFLQTAYPGYSTPTTGEQLELDAIAACVIGGASLKGGRGTVSGVLFGSLIMASLLNGMTLMAVSPEMTLIARGLVLAIAVWVDVRLSRTSGMRTAKAA